MKKKDESLALAMNWFNTLQDAQKIDAAEVMLSELLNADILRIFDEETAAELAEESGKPISEYLAPYWESCGEPIIDVSR